LVAESEINRTQLLEEWQAMTEGVRTFTDRMRSVGAFTSAAALVAAGLAAFRQRKPATVESKPSWFRTALKGAKLAGSLWLAFRARPR
jgi:hypothetical protein